MARLTAAALLALTPMAALAQDPPTSCTLLAQGGGEMTVSVDGRLISSDNQGGREARITAQSTGPATITVSAPFLVTAPTAYDPNGQTAEVAMRGEGALADLIRPFAQGPSAHPIDDVALSPLVFDARVRNDAGFAAGEYKLRTVVTCS